MKKWIVILSLLFVGCSTGMERVETLMKDPHYEKHQQSLDALEHVYLQKQMTYPEYQKKRKELQDTYDQEVQLREKKIRE